MKFRTWARLKLNLYRRRAYTDGLSAGYYQDLHKRSEGYRETNWLAPELDQLLLCNPRSVTEIGYGNGQFLRAVSPHVDSAIGIDWARSPEATDLPANVSLQTGDATKIPISPADLICSADVLEHFHPRDIRALVQKLHYAGRYNFHLIACYDDGHSHLSVMTPERWLKLFRTFSPDYHLVRTWERRRRFPAPVCIIANY